MLHFSCLQCYQNLAFEWTIISFEKDKLWRRKSTYLSHPAFARNPDMLFPYYSVPWGSPVPTYDNGTLAFIDGGFEIDWEKAKNYTTFSSTIDGEFDEFPEENYKWSEFYRKYFTSEDDAEEYEKLINSKMLSQKFANDKDYFKTLAIGTSFRTPGFQPHDWLYAVSMESDLNGRFHDRQGVCSKAYLK